MRKATKVAQLAVYHEAKELSETTYILSSNEARPHLLADIITLERQKEAVLVKG